MFYNISLPPVTLFVIKLSSVTNVLFRDENKLSVRLSASEIEDNIKRNVRKYRVQSTVV